MIASGSISTDQAHLHHEVRSRNVYPAKGEMPGVGRFFSQGAAGAATLVFLTTVAALFWHPTNGYNIFYIFLMPFYLAAGMLLSLFPALLIWGCTKLAGHRLSHVARAFITVLVVMLFNTAFVLFVPLRPDYVDQPELTEYLPVFAISATQSLVLGLVIGSRLQPWREIVRGVESLAAKSRVLTGITGFALRVLVVWGLMEAIVFMICDLQRNYRKEDRILAILTLAHFALAAIIVFARMRLLVLLPLSLIVNVPVALLIRKYAGTDYDYGFAIAAIVYLAVWATFLLSRWRATYDALSSLNAELRYYLID